MLAWIAYFTIVVVWGSTYFTIKLGLDSFTAYGMVATRFLVAAVLALMAGWMRGESAPRREELKHLILTGVLMLSGSNFLVSWAEQYVDTGLTAMLCAVIPIFLVLMGGERPSRQTWLGLILGLVGVGVLVDPFHGRVHLMGALAILLANMLWTYATVHSRRYMTGESLFYSGAVQMAAGGFVGLLMTPFTGGFLHAAITPEAFLAISYLAVFGSVVAFSAYMYLAKVWSHAKMGTYAYLNPVVAVILGWGILNEHLEPRMFWGMGLILGAVALVQLKGKKSQLRQNS